VQETSSGVYKCPFARGASSSCGSSSCASSVFCDSDYDPLDPPCCGSDYDPLDTPCLKKECELFIYKEGWAASSVFVDTARNVVLVGDLANRKIHVCNTDGSFVRDIDSVTSVNNFALKPGISSFLTDVGQPSNPTVDELLTFPMVLYDRFKNAIDLDAYDPDALDREYVGEGGVGILGGGG
jgi:hypothetical protein